MAESFSGIDRNSASGRVQSSGPGIIPGRARTLTSDPQSQSAGGERTAAQPAAERQTINLDGRRFDMAAPRGTYLNILV